LAVATAIVLLCAGVPISAASAAPTWQWPVEPAQVVRPFEPPDGPYGPGHRGVDLAVEPDQAVLAPSDGSISFAGLVAGTPVVVISHGDLRSTFQPVRSALPRGTYVNGGEAVGEIVADLRHCGEPCLHWGVLRGDDYLDPARLVSPRAARLLPFWTDGWTDSGRFGAGQDRQTVPQSRIVTASQAEISAHRSPAGPAHRVPAAVGIVLGLTGAVGCVVAIRGRRPP
jgi:hypothetical protein